MYNHGQKSWDTFAFLGRFPRILLCPAPPLTPQTTLDACIQNFFRVSTLFGVEGRRTERKWRKRCTVLWGNPEITENYEYCISVPRTFVHDCSCGDRYKVFSFHFLRYWWPTSLAAFTALRYQIPRLLMWSRNLCAGTSSVTRKNSFQRFKKDSSHNQAVASIEATTHSHDSEIRKLNF